MYSSVLDVIAMAQAGVMAMAAMQSMITCLAVIHPFLTANKYKPLPAAAQNSYKLIN
jgi:hypothetical protein